MLMEVDESSTASLIERDTTFLGHSEERFRSSGGLDEAKTSVQRESIRGLQAFEKPGAVFAEKSASLIECELEGRSGGRILPFGLFSALLASGMCVHFLDDISAGKDDVFETHRVCSSTVGQEMREMGLGANAERQWGGCGGNVVFTDCGAESLDISDRLSMSSRLQLEDEGVGGQGEVKAVDCEEMGWDATPGDVGAFQIPLPLSSSTTPSASTSCGFAAPWTSKTASSTPSSALGLVSMGNSGLLNHSG
ncbi:hypothetical protein M409DRAFT_60354 [Zasmidium cellare ATCC 36951]|uniref:Uncharacterized protein n=1 Tax=Zasmidium cellare ATCC 36951 TaxID=1080233 RepID=A0A6A6BZA8_ZASCE|nr:uncharacterized protein M409DRAFT_60354 [Zasmidium cellare ATCC 36951]KAF2159943.1 hypothetical protein M409DRAFT_60354 [Zasmidium cellare ATCC 36951]